MPTVCRNLDTRTPANGFADGRENDSALKPPEEEAGGCFFSIFSGVGEATFGGGGDFSFGGGGDVSFCGGGDFALEVVEIGLTSFGAFAGSKLILLT